MKKMCFSILVLSLLLACLTACSAEAAQPDEPETPPAPQANQAELSQPVLSEPEKTEISQEELEAIFEAVYTTASENHPADWSIDFQITDEIGKINSAIPDDKEAPSNLRSLYTDWRAAKIGGSEDADGQEWEAEVAESDGSTDEENNAEIERMLAEAWASLEGYDEERAGIEVIAGVTEDDIKENQYTDNDGGYDEGRDYNPSAAEDYTVDPDLAAKLAELGGVSGPSNYVDPNAGKTEEQIQQELEDAQKTEFRINGT